MFSLTCEFPAFLETHIQTPLLKKMLLVLPRMVKDRISRGWLIGCESYPSTGRKAGGLLKSAPNKQTVV